MKREETKRTVLFIKDTPEIVIAELITITTYYPWWDLFTQHSNGYMKTTEEVSRDWYSFSWFDEKGKQLSLGLCGWLDLELMRDRLRRLKEGISKSTIS